MTSAGTQDAFEWVGGLRRAAKDQADYLATQTALSTTGSGDSTSAERAAVYGTAGSGYTEIIAGSSDSTMWIVLSMLINDLDTTSTAPDRGALLSSANTQAGVAVSANDTFTKVIVACIDSDYVEDASFTCTEATVVVTPDAAAGLLVAGTAALAAALLN